MLLANMTVATTIAVNLPEQALLRRHEAPLERRLEGFSQKAARLGLPVDISSGGAISTSFNKIEDAASRKLLEVMSTKAMHRAKYFCSGMLDIAKVRDLVPVARHAETVSDPLAPRSVLALRAQRAALHALCTPKAALASRLTHPS
jgi:hypothetical protein